MTPSAERGAGEDDGARSRACSARRSRGRAAGRAWPSSWPPSAGRLPSTALSPTTRAGADRAAVVHDDVGAELDAVADRHVVADVQVRAARIGAAASRVQLHDARRRRRASVCIASSTSTTAQPLAAAAARLARLADRVDELLALEAQRLVVRRCAGSRCRRSARSRTRRRSRCSAAARRSCRRS